MKTGPLISKLTFLALGFALSFAGVAEAKTRKTHPAASPSPSPSPIPAESPAPNTAPALDPAAQKILDAALAAFKDGKLNEAEALFKKLLALVPDNPAGLVNLGEVQYRLKESVEAEKTLKKAVRVQPEAETAWLTLGVLYCDQEKPDAALAALSQAVLLNPKDGRAHNFLAVAVGKKGWLCAAEAELRSAIEIEPDLAEAHFNLALLYLQRSPPAIELARRHYEKALELGARPDQEIEKALAAP